MASSGWLDSSVGRAKPQSFELESRSSLNKGQMAELKVIIVDDSKGYFLGDGWEVLASLALGLSLLC